MNFKQFSLAAGFLLGSAGIASAAVVTGDLNLRTGPGTNYGVIDTMPAGARVKVLRCSGSWCRVAWGGSVGWASRSYIGTRGPVYAAAPPPVYYAPPPAVVTFGFGAGPRHYWGGHRRHGHHWRRHHRRHH